MREKRGSKLGFGDRKGKTKTKKKERNIFGVLQLMLNKKGNKNKQNIHIKTNKSR